VKTSRWRRAWGALLAAGVALICLVGVASSPDLAGADNPAPTTYYLALGGSASVGFQPTAARPQGQPTDTGYANDLLTIERNRWHGLQLVQFGCPGETSNLFLDGGDRCHPYESQMAEAVDFLHAHPETVLTTVDLGFNDIDHCLAFHMIDQACVTQRLAMVNQHLPQIIAAIRAAGSPTMRIVGVGHYDPFLGDTLRGIAGQDFARDSLAVIHRLNDALSSVYTAAGVPMADVAQAFQIDRTDPTDLPGVGNVPLNVARTCELTWDCTAVPSDSKEHPNDAGYQLIAHAIAIVIPA
jgi:lysophospholipase L1-like esterase